jgi:glycosyltransferase involved in cell wall biosynthesis
MSANQLVSIVMAVKNGERYLAQAIESVLAQTYQSFEIIVVDDSSNDDTKKIAKTYSDVRYFRQATNQGIAIARNIGMEKARGQLIAFHSHDDLWLPDKLSRQIDCFARAPELQYTLTWFKYFLEPGCPLPPGFNPGLLGQSLIGRIPETVVARRQLFDQIGNFNSEFYLANDVDWFARAKDHGAPMAVIPEVLVLKRLHNANITYNSKANAELLELLKQSIQRQRLQQHDQSKAHKGEGA